LPWVYKSEPVNTNNKNVEAPQAQGSNFKLQTSNFKEVPNHKGPLFEPYKNYKIIEKV
jgi:hypothetical protein